MTDSIKITKDDSTCLFCEEKKKVISFSVFDPLAGEYGETIRLSVCFDCINTHIKDQGLRITLNLLVSK